MPPWPRTSPPLPRSPAPRTRSAAVAPPKAKRSPRRFLLPLILIAAAVYGAHWAYDYFTEGRFLVSTDDAYVGADTVIVAPKIAGYVTEVDVSNNQEVHAGDLLARIDAGDYQLAVDAAKAKVATQDATIARIGRQIEAQRAMIAQAAGADRRPRDAPPTAPTPTQQRASLEFDRAQKLAQTSFGSQQRLEQATADKKRTAAVGRRRQCDAGLGAGAARLRQGQSRRAASAAERGANTRRAELANAVERAERDLSFTEIRAPFDGVVGNKAVEVGQYAQPGSAPARRGAARQRLCRRQLQGDAARGRSSPARRSTSRSTPIGGRSVEGVVRSIAPASGAQFSLLPPDNATGNFTKIVQRVTVRIGFDREAIKERMSAAGPVGGRHGAHARRVAAEADAGRRAGPRQIGRRI